MLEKPTKKVIPVRRIVGRYQVEGKITCIPAPRSAKEAELVESLIDRQVKILIRDRMIEDLLSSDDTYTGASHPFADGASNDD